MIRQKELFDESPRSIFKQTGWRRPHPEMILQDSDILLKVTKYDFNIYEDGFEEYARRRGALSGAGKKNSDWWKIVMDHSWTEEKFLDSDIYKENEERRTLWKVFLIAKAQLQDVWEVWDSLGRPRVGAERAVTPIRQIEICPSLGDEEPAFFEQFKKLSFVAQKTFVYIARFIYWGVKNAERKQETTIQDRYVLKAQRGIEVFQWDEATLKLLNAHGLILYAEGKIRLNPLVDLEIIGKFLEIYSRSYIDRFPCCVTENPIALINELSKKIFIGSFASPKRSTKVLRPYDADSTDSWAFCVPRCFNDALDIKYGEYLYNKVPYGIWTQGTNFNFQRADVLYDKTQIGKSWSETLQEINYRVYVEIAYPASSPDKEPKDDKKPEEKRKIIKLNPGLVRFTIKVPNSSKTGLEFFDTRELTQADFVKMLIGGI